MATWELRLGNYTKVNLREMVLGFHENGSGVDTLVKKGFSSEGEELGVSGIWGTINVDQSISGQIKSSKRRQSGYAY